MFRSLCLFAALLLLSTCRKDATVPKYDFRDALVGTYTCTIHQWQYAELGFPPTHTTTYRDILIGSDTLLVTKVSTDSTSVIVKGRIYSTINKSDTTALSYNPLPNGSNFLQLSFYTAQDSLVFSNILPYDSNFYTDGVSYRGRRIR